jgi:hypothetical protein
MCEPSKKLKIKFIVKKRKVVSTLKVTTLKRKIINGEPDRRVTIEKK